MIVETVTCFTEQEFRFLWLQPNPEFGTNNGAGWKGVIRWCQKYSDCLYEYLNGLTPQIDLLIIQMDGDVARSEKEIYCRSVPDICDGQFKEDPLNCSIAKTGRCPQKLPPNSVCDSISTGYASYLENLLRNHIGTDKRIKSVITIPCDSTDTWILAAFEELDNPEDICSPWDIIARKKDYHGILSEKSVLRH